MRILYRFYVLVKSYLNFFIGRVEDPEKLLNQLILDMQEQLILAKKQVAISISDEKKLKRQFEKEVLNASEWEQRAVTSLRSGLETLAKKSLERKCEHDSLANSIEMQWKAQKKSVDRLKDSLRLLSGRINEAKRKKNILSARSKRAKAQKMISDTISEISNDHASASLERMEDNINRLEADASATSEMVDEISSDELEGKISYLDSARVNENLSLLKRRINYKDKKIIKEKNNELISDIEREIQYEVDFKNKK